MTTWTQANDRGDILGSGSKANVYPSGVFGCHARSVTPQSVANNTPTVIDLELELHDTNAMHSTSVNISRVNLNTIAISGPEGTRFVISAMVQFEANATGGRLCSIIFSNGTEVAHGTCQNAGAASTCEVQASQVVTITSDTLYVQVWAGQASGGPLNVTEANLAAFLHKV